MLAGRTRVPATGRCPCEADTGSDRRRSAREERYAARSHLRRDGLGGLEEQIVGDLAEQTRRRVPEPAVAAEPPVGHSDRIRARAEQPVDSATDVRHAPARLE